MGKVLAPFLKQDEATLAAFPRTTNGLTLDYADYQPVIELGVRYGAIPKSFPAKDVVTVLGNG
jgi:hypothetical protein